jgi:hypothetical protein
MSVPKGKSACPERESALQELLFGELGVVERKELEHHLAVCSRCRRALGDARHGLAALSMLEDAPLPFGEHEMTSDEPTHPEVAWVDFQRKLRLRQDQEEERTTASWWLHRAAAAAALLVLGFGLGRWGTASRESGGGVTDPHAQSASIDELKVDAQAVEALTRAELLSDVGLRYVNGLQQLLQGVMETPAGDVKAVDIASTREQAADLIRDGRLLRRTLDPSRDGAFLDTIDRAEIMLEELAAVENDPGGTSVRIVQATLRGSRLLYQIAALNVQKEVDIALEASGWLGEELVERKEF